jgi:hypothetical protein
MSSGVVSGVAMITGVLDDNVVSQDKTTKLIEAFNRYV